MMRYILSVVILFNLLVSISYAGNVSQGLKNLYHNAMLNPETFDQLIQKDRLRLRDTYSPCLKSIISRHWNQAQVEVPRCRNVSGAGHDYLQCIRNTPASSAVVSSQSMLAVLNGKILWRNTIYGDGMIKAKHIYQQFGLDYKGMVNLIFRMSGQLYQCPTN